MVDWKKRYDELAAFAKTFVDKVQELDFISSRIKDHLADSDKQSMRERGKRRLLRLKEAVTLAAEYDHSRDAAPHLYEAGTLINARITGNIASVYLDDDGDGHLYFPADKCEVIELDEDEVDWDKVICQG